MIIIKKELTNEVLELSDTKLNELYIEYFNDFFTIDRFAEYHNLTRYEASIIIDLGRKINNKEAV